MVFIGHTHVGGNSYVSVTSLLVICVSWLSRTEIKRKEALLETVTLQEIYLVVSILFCVMVHKQVA